MDFVPLDFSEFVDRDQKLKNIIRYNAFNPMWYRTDLLIHSHRIVWLVEELIPYALEAYPHFDADAARALAAVHDDLEISLGDIMLAEKVNMSTDQHKVLHKREQDAIETVAQMFGNKKVNGFDYKSLMTRYQEFEEFLDPARGIELSDPEACLVKYCDKLEGFAESLHEVFAGNDAFTHGYSETTSAPYTVYSNILNNFTKPFPIFEPMRKFDHPLLSFVAPLDVVEVAKQGKEHTPDSIQQKTGYAHYDAWKEVSLKRGGAEFLSQMTTRIE